MGIDARARGESLRGRWSFVFVSLITAAALGIATLVAAPERLSRVTVPPAPATSIEAPSTEVESPPEGATSSAKAPSERSAPKPRVATMLHGMCSNVVNACETMRAAVPDGFILACPKGNRRCGDGFDWGGDGEEKARHLDEAVPMAIEGVEVADDGKDILMGFSRGAFVARDVAYARPGRYRALVLIGAATIPDPKLLAASGIEKVVLASGDHDGAAKTMRAARTILVASGIQARFVSLGPVYHALPADSAKRLRDAVRWAAE